MWVLIDLLNPLISWQLEAPPNSLAKLVNVGALKLLVGY